MTLDEIHGKLEVLRDNLERLSEIPQGSLEEFSADFRNVDSALHRLQTSIQALIDVGTLAVARLGLGPASSSTDMLARLEKAGRLPSGAADRFTPLFAFRNRVVHLYDRIDPAIVHRILTEDRTDLEELLALLLEALEGTAAPEG